MDNLIHRSHKKCTFLIIGAGASGIAAAARLTAAGYTKSDDVVVLEASDRIGGRINTKSFCGNLVELGAQWVHGETGNIIYDTVKSLQLDLLDDSATNFIHVQNVLSDKTLVDTDSTAKLYSFCERIRDSIDEKTLDVGGSFADYFLPRYYEYVEREMPGINGDVRDGFLEWVHQFYNSLEGSDSWFETSISSLVAYRECEGNSLIKWNKGGYDNVFQVICKNCGVDKFKVLEKIKLNKEVRRICWNECQMDMAGSRSNVIVYCNDGSVYLADRVIVTVSVGVLKENLDTMFDPKLPVDKINAIEGLGFGTVDKIFIKFPYKWWPDSCPGFSLLWTKYDQKNTDFIRDEGKWLKDVFGFYIVDGAEDLLCGWVVGESARIMEQQSDECVLNACYRLLNKFLDGCFRIPKPLAVLRSRWQSDPYIRGGYSFRSVKSSRFNSSSTQLAHPLINDSGEKVVLFAGEATHPCYFSTVHGAIETGYKQAEEAISYIRSCSAIEMAFSSSSVCSQYTVVVIGAGIAGLAASTTLVEAGIKDIILIEGQDRPGGRVKSVPLASSSSERDGWLELGAQWLHGQGSHLYCIAESSGLLSDVISFEALGQYLKGNGKEIDTALVGDVANEVANILEDCEKFFLHGSESEIPASVGQYLCKRFNEYISRCNDSSPVMQDKMDLFDWHLRFQVIDNSCHDLDELSAKSWGRYKFCGGTDYINFKRGYSSLVDHLVDSLPEGILKLNTTVTNVKYGNVRKSISHSRKNNFIITESDNMTDPSLSPVVVTCDDGNVYVCRHVVVTSSLGFLKRNHESMFSPSLPPYLVKSIEGIGFGVINKIFLCYNKPWWTEDQYGFQIIWPSTANDCCMVLDSDQMWMRDISGFDVLPDTPGVLLGWIGREGAVSVERLSETQIGEQCTLLLRNFTGKNDIPLPLKVFRSQWHSNRLVCGGYSHLTTACDLSHPDVDATPENLSLPVYIQTEEDVKHPVILLAGEATHEKYFSTTHGAFESGMRQAHQILQFMSSQKDMKK